MWWFLQFSCFCYLRVWLCAAKSVLLWFLVLSSPVVWCCLSFCGFVYFHVLCAEFLVESHVVLTGSAYIVLISTYCGRFLLLHLFSLIELLGRYPRFEVTFIQCPIYLTACPSCFSCFCWEICMILMGLPLYVICFFSPIGFSIFYLFSVLVVLMVICHGEFPFWSSLLVFWRIPLPG
jgi:hypothetical protein